MSSRLAALVSCLCLVGALGAMAEPPGRGTLVPIDGRLVDEAGQPIVGAIVMLSAGREHFSIRSLGKTEQVPLLQPAITDADGRFAHRWSWDGHHNRFELIVGVEVRREGRPDFEEIVRRDITDATASGSPVVLGDWTVRDAGLLRFLVRWSAGGASAEEAKVFGELGRPDRITAEPDEIDAWWYFARGKVYRFQDGGLDQVIHFEPVSSSDG
ncbi:MAG: carboxypeptidase-like regulatory domain-containing protein [Acidobacteriota bacterium]